MSWSTYLFAVLGGIVGGVINTLAGSGSAVTLPLLIFLGLPADVANATNRIGVVVQNAVGIATFRRSGKLVLGGGVWLTIPASIGATIGAFIAVDLDRRTTEIVIAVMLAVVLVTTLLKPEKWVREQSAAKEGPPSPLMFFVFFLIGAYGGFIQVGVGIFLLAALVMGVGYTLVESNAYKLVITLVMTLVALGVFISTVHIDWVLGCAMAVGQSIGAWLAARFMVRSPNATIWVRRLLILVIIASIAKLFGLFALIPEMFNR